MGTYETILNRRTIRRFQQKPVAKDILKKLVAAARVAPSASNIQPLEYLIIDDPGLLPQVFVSTAWAGTIAPRGTPPEGQRPVAYIIVLVNDTIKNEQYYKYDVGAAIENMLLTALEAGIASCWLGAIKKDALRESFSIPKHFIIDSVVALGYPDEKSVIEEAKDSIKYWKDEQGVMHIPKRPLEKIMHFNKL